MPINHRQIIGVAGTNGSGKDAAGLTLADRHGYLFVSVTDLLRAELNKRGKPVDRVNLRELSAEWRRQFGNGVLVDRAVDQYKRLDDKYVGVAIASLRNPAEADRIHELGGTVIWVDASPETRYKRIQSNAEARARSGEDAKTYEEFLAEEEAEMHPSGDSATLNMSAVKQRADLLLDNEGTDLTHFQDFITEQLFGVPQKLDVPVRAPGSAATPAEAAASQPSASVPPPVAPEPPTQPV